MPYPRLINLSETVEKEIITYLRDQIMNHKMERNDWVQELMDMQKSYWAKPNTERRTFPFVGASNIIIPLNAIAVESTHARLMMTLFGVDPFLNCKTVSDLDLGLDPITQLPQTIQDAEVPLEDFLSHELIFKMDARRIFGDCSLDMIKFGTVWGKSGYERVVKKAVVENTAGQEEEIRVIIKDGATIDRVPLANFIMPFYSQNPQLAPWCGEIHTDTKNYIRQASVDGFFKKDTYKKLENWIIVSTTGNNQERKFEHQKEILENQQPVWPQRLDWYEFWLSWDVDGDGRDEEIVIHYHYDSNFIMSARYNWYRDLHRPYRYGNYFPVEGRWAGIGICRQNEQFQKEITVLHRQRLDNATLANIRMLKIHKLSGYGPGEPVFPGKLWFVDDMTHIDSVQMGDVYQSSFANEQATLLYSQQRTGINELTLGQPSQGTPGTATDAMARLQESKLKFDFTFANYKEFIGQLVLDSLVNMAQFGVRSKQYFDVVSKGYLVKNVLALDPVQIRDSLLFEISVSGQNGNRVLDRQSWKEIAGILSQYYQGQMQFAQVLQSPQLIQTISSKAMLSINEVMRQLLQTYDVRNLDRIIISEIEGILRNGQTQPGNSGIITGGNPNTQGNGQSQGLPPIQEIAQLLSSFGAGSS